MSYNRRSFIRSNAFIAGCLLLSKSASALAAASKNINTLDASGEGFHIYHTNDMRGKVSHGANNPGGLHQFKKTLENQLLSGILLDGGNFLRAGSGRGEDEDFVYLMNQAGYHAVTLGPSELKKGQQYLADLSRHMQFDLINCNYSFSNMQLQKAVKPYLILKYGKRTVGITGVGAPVQVEGIEVNDPHVSLSKTVEILKQEGCSLIVCLSALGFEKDTFNNMALAEASKNVDFIIGAGASGSKNSGSSILKNSTGYDVLLSHTASEARVFTHTSFNSDKAINISTRIPGLPAKANHAKELAGINTRLINNSLT